MKKLIHILVVTAFFHDNLPCIAMEGRDRSDSLDSLLSSFKNPSPVEQKTPSKFIFLSTQNEEVRRVLPRPSQAPRNRILQKAGGWISGRSLLHPLSIHALPSIQPPWEKPMWGEALPSSGEGRPFTVIPGRRADRLSHVPDSKQP